MQFADKNWKRWDLKMLWEETVNEAKLRNGHTDAGEGRVQKEEASQRSGMYAEEGRRRREISVEL